ncbi:MAG: hypothetical protein LBF27_05900 [Sphingobacterium sp.]|jgi:hypothetical protein|nr:hypothetical protein [Sphingobacterium sp.]
MESLIQVIILICLLIVIVLLLVDKIKIVKAVQQVTEKNKSQEDIDIMGSSNTINDRVYKKPITIHEKLIRPNHMMDVQKIGEQHILEIEPAITADGEWDDETLHFDERFDQAVSLEELMNVGKLLQQSNIESEQENVVRDVLQKIQGTELYDHLESSIESSSAKIALLLDKNLKSTGLFESDEKASFDINDFI